MKAKKLISVLLALIMVLSSVPFAYAADEITSGQCGDNAYYSFDEKTGTLTISGSGEMYDLTYPLTIPWDDFKEKIETVIIEPGLTNIGGYAFVSCANLTSVTIPETVTCINCLAFCGCTKLKNITIPESVTTIRHSVFYNCSSLETITIPEGVDKIESDLFFGCSSLKSVSLPDGITEIGFEAFLDCKMIENIELPKSLIAIDKYAFEGCSNLKSIVIPEGVISIDSPVFTNCISLESVTIPSSLGFIPNKIFSECYNLKEIKVSENNSNYFDIDGVLFNKDKSELVVYPYGKEETAYTIPAGVKRIAENAFNFCSNLKEVTICNAVEEIGDEAFDFCINLERLNFGEGIKKIGIGSFRGLLSIKNEIILNEGLEEIGGEAFLLLKQNKLTIPSTVTYIGKDAFNYSDVDIIVNKSKVASLPLSDFYYSKQGINIAMDYHKIYYNFIFQELYKNGFDISEEEELEAFETMISEINRNYGTSFKDANEMFEYIEKDVSDKPYYNIVCYEDSVQHEVCIENGYNHSIIGSTCDDTCGIHNIYTNDIIQPTCTDNGYKGGIVCLDCEKIFEVAEVIPATGHTPEIQEGLRPSCTEIGYEDAMVCAVCGELLEDLKLIQATGHTDNNNDGICDNCGEVYEDFEPEPIPETLGDRIISFFKGIVDAILALFRKLFG